MSQFTKMKLFTGTANPQLGQEIADFLGIALGEVTISRFACGEIYVKYEESIRGVDVFILQPLSHPVNENIMELLIMIDAARRASAGRITAVIPYFGYARQEKKDAPREPITARMVGDILTAVGTERVITMDLHSPAIQGFFSIPVDHLTALPMLAQYCAQKQVPNPVVISADAGGVKKAEKLATRLDVPIGVMYKRRPSHNVAEMTTFIGDVEGKTPIIIEDIIDTGGSLMQVCRALLDRGCNREIHIMASHGVFSDPAFERLDFEPIKEIVVTNSIAVPADKKLEKMTVLSIAPLLGDAIRRIHHDVSVSVLFD